MFQPRFCVNERPFIFKDGLKYVSDLWVGLEAASRLLRGCSLFQGNLYRTHFCLCQSHVVPILRPPTALSLPCHSWTRIGLSVEKRKKLDLQPQATTLVESLHTVVFSPFSAFFIFSPVFMLFGTFFSHFEDFLEFWLNFEKCASAEKISKSKQIRNVWPVNDKFVNEFYF